MSRISNLIEEIRNRLKELELLTNPSSFPEIPPHVVDISINNLRLSDSSISFNKTDFQISKAKLIELCSLIVKGSNTEINIKPFVETFDPNRCNCYCIVKEIPRRDKFLNEDENLYYDKVTRKYYSQCRMPKDKCNNNYCARHIGTNQIDVSNMKILTNSKYILLLDTSVREYCKMYLSTSLITPVPAPPPAPGLSPISAHVQVLKSNVTPVTAVTPVTHVPSILKKASAQATKALKKVPVPKVKEPISSDSDPDSDPSSETSEVDMIVSKVIDTLKPASAASAASSAAPAAACESELDSDSEPEDPEDSDDCMLDADEIHDEAGNTYYIDESKSVIKLDEDGYGVRLGMLKEFKSGNLFYKNKRWKIDYFPKK
jgi:hypothetical protein